MKMMKYVYTVFQKNEQGFTFFSMLMTMAILFITLPLLAYLLQTVNYSSNYDEISTQQFFSFLQNDVIHASDYTITNDTIELTVQEQGDKEDATFASFEQYGQLIRRQVDGSGHEIYLRDIEDFTVNSLPYGFHVNVLTLKGEHYEKTIVFSD